MSLTYAQAVDDMSTMFKTAWDTTGWQVIWDNVRDQRDANEDPWARYIIRHSSGSQSSLGGVGSRMFSRSGIILISIFFPIGKGLSVPYSLGKLAADVYEGNHSPNGVWFRNVIATEKGRDGEFFQTDVVVDFEYDEIK